MKRLVVLSCIWFSIAPTAVQAQPVAPIVRVIEQENQELLRQSAQFETVSFVAFPFACETSALSTEMQAEIQNQRNKVGGKTKFAFKVIGDSSKDDSATIGQSRKRISNVKRQLVSLGVPAEDISTALTVTKNSGLPYCASVSISLGMPGAGG